jgi:hypothetical protein
VDGGVRLVAARAASGVGVRPRSLGRNLGCCLAKHENQSAPGAGVKANQAR